MGLPEEKIKEAFERVRGTHYVSMELNDTGGGEFEVFLYPFKVLEVYFEGTSDAYYVPVSIDVPYQYKLLIEGRIPHDHPYGLLSTSEIVNDFWMPIRNAGKKSRHAGKNPCKGLSCDEKSDLAKVTLTVSSTEHGGEAVTELCLFPEAWLYEPKYGLTGEQRVVRALENATRLLGEEIRKCYEAQTMFSLNSAVTLDKVSCELSMELANSCLDIEFGTA